MKLIIDTDAGIDDAVAILMALNHPQTTLLALTTVMGNISLEQATHNTGVILDVANAPAIPVYRGCGRPLLQYAPLDAAIIHGADGLGGASVPTTRSIQPEAASLALVRLVRENPGQITLVTLGPLTNIALAMRLAPDFLTNLNQLVIMGGSIDGRGNTTPAAEFNLLVDPEAAAAVFEACHRAHLEPLVVSWETTLTHAIPMPDWDNLIAGVSPVAQFLQKMTDHLKRIWDFGSVLWPDPLAMAVALEPDLIIEQEARHVTVAYGHTPARGHTIVDYRMAADVQHPNARLVRKVNLPAFQTLLHQITQ